MSDEKKKDKYKNIHNSEYNRRMLKVAEEYTALMKIQMKMKLDKMKEGAWNIANNSKNPELKKVCRELDKLKIE